MTWKKIKDERFEMAWYNGRHTIYIDKSTKHKGWIVGIASPSDGYTVTHPYERSKVDAINTAKILMRKSEQEFQEVIE